MEAALHTRFRDGPTYLWTLSEKILVSCPRCKARALVSRAGPSFSCVDCGHSHRDTGNGWFGMAKACVKRKCGWCGRRLSRTQRRAGPHPSKLGVCCPSCSHWNYIEANWHPDPQDEPFDPHFGYGLWLQTRCAGNVLWAYNHQHLEFIRAYVASSLRERTPNTNSSLASRLPKWLKSAKNRQAVERAVKRLEARIDS